MLYHQTMYMKRLFYVVLAAGVVCNSCKTQTPKSTTTLHFEEDSSQSPKDGHNSRNSLDWAGTYRGVVPCADCPGIATTLTINLDQSYVLQTRYLGKEDAGKRYHGSFTWSTDGGIIALAGHVDGYK